MPSCRAILRSALKVPVYMGALPPLALPMRIPMCCVCNRVFTTHRGFVTCGGSLSEHKIPHSTNADQQETHYWQPLAAPGRT